MRPDIAWLGLLFLLSPVVLMADDLVSVKTQAREVGYMIGDVVTQTVEVQTPDGYRLDEHSLPQRRGDGAHIELRRASHEAIAEGDRMLHLIRLDWQVFRAMRDIRPVDLRPLTLQFRHDDKVLTARVAPLQILISPILPTVLDGDYSQPRADVAPLPQPLQPWWLRLALSAAGLLVAVGYFAWRFDWLPFLSLRVSPFRLAWRNIRGLRKRQKQDPSAPQQAMRVLSRAFDAYAGMAMSSERLPLLFDRHPEFLPCRVNIEAFYAEIRRIFFAGGTPTLEIVELAKLARQLSRLETR